jgi:hypothetical protein
VFQLLAPLNVALSPIPTFQRYLRIISCTLSIEIEKNILCNSPHNNQNRRENEPESRTPEFQNVIHHQQQHHHQPRSLTILRPTRYPAHSHNRNPKEKWGPCGSAHHGSVAADRRRRRHRRRERRSLPMAHDRASSIHTTCASRTVADGVDQVAGGVAKSQTALAIKALQRTSRSLGGQPLPIQRKAAL